MPMQVVDSDKSLAAQARVLELISRDVPATLDNVEGRLSDFVSLPPATVAALASQDRLRVTGENDVLVSRVVSCRGAVSCMEA
jgi:hypothetical protein